MAISEQALQAARQGAEKYAPAQLELLRRFSEIDHGTGNVEGNRKVIEVMKEVFDSMDVDFSLVESTTGGHHVVARIKPEHSTGKIILNSHLDTVFKPGDAAAHPSASRAITPTAWASRTAWAALWSPAMR